MSDNKLVIVAGIAWDSTANPVWEKAEMLLRSRPDASLHLCHVVGRSALKAETAERSTIDESIAQLHAWVLEKAGRDNPICAQIHLEVAIGDDAADEIVQLAVDDDADLVLLGTHARTGVAKLVLGSVAEKVLHRAPCAVLIARATDFDRTKSPSIAPAPAPGHKPFRPHEQRYHSSVVFSTYDTSVNPTGM